MLTISPVNAFSDNYIWVLQRHTGAIAIDPGDAAPLLAFLAAHQLDLQGVLLTHHHSDHIGGVGELLQRNPKLTIAGPASLAEVNHPLQQGSSIDLLGCHFEVMAVPGHTLDHLAYYAAPWLFCGDTLFGAGCGRLFEGSPAQMLGSLNRLAALPSDTQIFPAHEYTVDNLRFARVIEPDNLQIKQRLISDELKRAGGLPTLPCNLEGELATNPFLRCANENVKSVVAQHQQQEIGDLLETFAALRAWKNGFRPEIN